MGKKGWMETNFFLLPCSPCVLAKSNTEMEETAKPFGGDAPWGIDGLGHSHLHVAPQPKSARTQAGMQDGSTPDPRLGNPQGLGLWDGWQGK